MTTTAPAIELREGRFARFEAIQWWKQSLLRDARVLVAGAGALGNEVIKNLALLGVGHVVIIDMDRIELSNLSRSVLFRAEDEGQFKADCAARAAQSIYPDIDVRALTGNLLADVGLGWFRWAQVVIGALDNREARVFLNSACARTDRPWIDGGIEVLQGIARGFHAPATACYECTMSAVDWDLLNKRRSCSLLARRALEQRGTPTTPTTASIIGAIQAQEAVKLLHGMDSLIGRGFVFEGAGHNSYTTSYPINPDCQWHYQEPAEIIALESVNSDTPLKEIVAAAGKTWLGECDALDLSRELVERLECPACHSIESVRQPIEHVDENRARCACGAERVPHFVHSIPRGGTLLEKSAREIGLPQWDIVWARRGLSWLGCEIAGDNPFMPRAG